MAQLNITLNQEEILQLLQDNQGDAFKRLLSDSLNSILEAESTEQLGAQRYQRTDFRVDSRNGSRERTLNTRIGSITLTVPRHRNQPFRSLVFDNYSRSEAALIASMAEMVVNGVSTRKVSTVMETLCGKTFSKSMVSEVCKELDVAVNDFKNRRLDNVYPFLLVDATYLKVREGSRVTSKAFMIALAVTESGRREIVGFEVYDNESKETWRNFLENLKERGLSGLRMVTSDAHEGILYAIRKVFPEVPWQRCQTHFSRNILDHAPKKYQKAIHAALLEIYHSESLEEACRKRDELIEEYREVAGKAMECLENGFQSVMTVMVLPGSMRKLFRTTNHLERLNREIKRRASVIVVFPNTASIIRLMGSVLMERHEIYSIQHHLAIKKTDLEALRGKTGHLLQDIAKEQDRLCRAA